VHKEDIIDIENRHMANVYAKKPLIIVKGKGAIVWDIDGKEYIDCMSGYGVVLVGHSNPQVIEAINKQVEKLITFHGSFYNDLRAGLVKKIVEIAPEELNRVFFSNSGAEAVEAAIKLARKYTGKKEIIAMVRGFHGKTMGALSATWNEKYKKGFEPLLPGFKHVPYGRAEKVREAITDQTAAVIVEPVQGEGGVYIPPDDYLPALRELCTEKNVLLIVDEVQTGLGRTGKMFACQHWNVNPDVMCLAKGIASGIPMGATMTKEEIMACLGIGEHTTTLGGNALACAAASATIDYIINEKLPERAAATGKYFKDELDTLGRKYKLVREVRGLGLMLGMELRFEVRDILFKALDHGVIILDAGRNVLRFLPPLIIEKPQVDKVVSVLDKLLAEEEHVKIRS